jgi:hypothetical protein
MNLSPLIKPIGLSSKHLLKIGENQVHRHARLATKSSRHTLIRWNHKTLNADVQRKQARNFIGQPVRSFIVTFLNADLQ